ncbi:MAG TPA: Gfo/Idh/MocA family oxidoreductase, partial [Blastocatellia bacterium]|nr:Gfo/Idh/MocA family oxidoreductase [Blastocatellia bacterium]
MTNEIGFGVVGGGMIGAVQAAAIQQINGARLLAVCGRDAQRTADFAARFGVSSYTSYEEFLKHPGLHIVNICTPSGTHAELGIQAAEAGKHVLAEKPI